MECGFSIVISTKQKLKNWSSTETEIVGPDNFMPAICWTRYLMESQGYTVNVDKLYHDNTSSILLEKNGKALSSKRTKHINICYFFITDQIRKNKVSVIWCPTGSIIADCATKPLQCALFKKFRDMIMGVVPAQDPGTGKLKTTPTDAASASRPSKDKKGLVTAPHKCVGI
jgi:hypothetical protein